MIKLENTEVVGWEHAIRGMRNPKNSHDRMDSDFGCRIDRTTDHIIEDYEDGHVTLCKECGWCEPLCDCTDPHDPKREYIIGPNDHKLMMNLAAGGPVHAKYRRMIAVYVDITCHHTWWAEFDTYKVGTVRNSCSKMHKIHVKEFTRDDFSHEGIDEVGDFAEETFNNTIETLEKLRVLFNETQEKKYWRAIIDLLPMGFNLKATVMLNYEVLVGMYRDRKNHKLSEWREFCKWVESLPYSEIITGKVDEQMDNVDFVEAMYRARDELRNQQPPKNLYFFTGGTGFPDDVCVEYFKQSNVIVVTRDGKQYCKGKLLEENNGQT